jgi:hypothetical protein
MARGFILVDQWHSHAKTWEELADPERHTGDAAQVDKLWSFQAPKITDQEPGCPIGHVVMRVEDDGSLTKIRANYDSSD